AVTNVLAVDNHTIRSVLFDELRQSRQTGLEAHHTDYIADKQNIETLRHAVLYKLSIYQPVRAPVGRNHKLKIYCTTASKFFQRPSCLRLSGRRYTKFGTAD